METALAQNLAVTMMTEHGLTQKGWRFKFDDAKKRLGLCTWATKTISMSRNMVAYATLEDVQQTMLHEIAHALLGARDANGNRIGHSALWKEKARSIGYTGARTMKNPYTTAMNPVTPEAAEAQALQPHRDIRVGDGVQMGNGLRGRVADILRVNYRVIAENGTAWTCPFGSLTPLGEDAQVNVDLPVRANEGENIRILGSSHLAGSVLKVDRVLRSKYHVTVPGGRQIAVPFALATAA